MLEKEIEDYFVWVVEKKLQGKAWKFVSPSNRGVSDRIACLPDGSTWFVELKRKGGKLSKLQQLFMGEMKSLNQNHAVLWSKDDIDIWAAALSRNGERLHLRK
jgi:hypothetical protein